MNTLLYTSAYLLIGIIVTIALHFKSAKRDDSWHVRFVGDAVITILWPVFLLLRILTRIL